MSNELPISRRAILGASAVIPALLLASHASAATGVTPGRGDWDRAVAAMEKAAREDAEFDQVYERANAAFVADCPNPDTIPWRRSVLHPHSRAWTADDLDAYEEQWLDQRGKTWWGGEEAERRGREQIGQVREYRRQLAAAEAKHDMLSITAEWDRRGEALCDATWALFAVPAPDLSALLWKSEHLFGGTVDSEHECMAWNADIMATYMSDVRRLLSGEG